MKNKEYFIGIDISSEYFTVSIYHSSDKSTTTLISNYPNVIIGFERFLNILSQMKVTSENSIICMEATGVYGQALSYYLCSQGYSVAVEPPLKVKRAFKLSANKNDKVDSQQIAEYCWRFADDLHHWSPKNEILEQISTLLTLREQFVTQLIANKNALKNFKRRYIQTQLANDMCEKEIAMLNDHIRKIDKQINDLINKDTNYKQMIDLLKSITGIGMYFAANLLVLSNGFQRTLEPKSLASYLGICPFENKSGKSIWHKSRSKGFGPSQLRKLIFLASMCLCEYHPDTKKYFLRKVAEGKPKHLVLNNIANRLLRVVCAIIRDKKPYIKNYVSINPLYLRPA